MTEAQLKKQLHDLGVDEQTWPILALLPLVQVAWADGKVQKPERNTILDVAEKEYVLDPRGRAALESWLDSPPDEAFIERARQATLLLAERYPVIVQPSTLLGQCKAVAEAAGGLFGIGNPISEEEQHVLDTLFADVQASENSSWDWVKELERKPVQSRLPADHPASRATARRPAPPAAAPRAAAPRGPDEPIPGLGFQPAPLGK